MEDNENEENYLNNVKVILNKNQYDHFAEVYDKFEKELVI